MYKQDDWNDIVKLFIYDLSKDVSLDQALQYFASNYTEICQRFEEECSEDTFEENEEEPLDVYFERKMKPMWDYVYNLQKQVNNIEMHKPLIPSVTAPGWQNPPGGYKVTCDANGNVPLSSTMNDSISFPNTVTVNTNWTDEQLEEWSNIMFGDPAKRR